MKYNSRGQYGMQDGTKQNVMEMRRPRRRRSLWVVVLSTVAVLAIAGALVLVVGRSVRAQRSDPPPDMTPTPSPWLYLAPADGVPGTLVNITGGGWQPGGTVLVRLDDPASEQDAQPLVASALVGADGWFTASFVLEQEEQGQSLPRGVVVVASVPATTETASAVFRIMAPSDPGPEPPPTPRPQPPDTPGPNPEPDAECTDRFTFVADVTVPDNTRLLAGQSFVKTWRIRNTGTCTWDSGYSLAFVNGSRMGGPVAVPLPGTVLPGSTVDVSVNLVAPVQSGTYQGDWQLRNSESVLLNSDSQSGAVLWVRIVVNPTPTSVLPITGWRGEYYAGHGLAGSPVLVRDDEAIDFDWGYLAPASALPSDGFSVRWTRSVFFEEGLYRFHAEVDDGMRLYVDGALVLDTWQDGGQRHVSAERTLTGAYHSVRVEYYENSGAAFIQVWWSKLGGLYPDWKGEYWSNSGLHGTPTVVRNDVAVDFNWRLGAPAAGLPADGFSAAWTRVANFAAATYRFHVLVDDGARLYVGDRLIIDSWTDGALRELTADVPMVQGQHRLRVEFYERTGEARIRVWWDRIEASFPDWRGSYWPNRTLSGNPTFVRNDRNIDFNWGTGSPASGFPTDSFSARWVRQVRFEPGIYRFLVRSDDGVRVYVDGERILNEWHESSGGTVYTVEQALQGQHRVVVEYYEGGGNALIRFWWRKVGDWPVPTPNNPPAALNDVVTTDEDTPVDVNVLANDSDPDGDTLVVSAHDAVSTEGGTVVCTGPGVCTYTPTPEYFGSDSFRYTVGDGRGGASTAVVTVTINPVNDPPVAVDDEISTELDTAVEIDVLANDFDPEGDSLAVSAYDALSAQGGTVVCTQLGVCTYTPPLAFNGLDTFSYTIDDGHSGTGYATVTVTVGEVEGATLGSILSAFLTAYR